MSFSLNNITYQAQFFRIYNPSDKKKFDDLVASTKYLSICDEIQSQLEELIELRNPSCELTINELKQKVLSQLKEKSINEYGVWVFYPWSNRLVHLLDEKEFIEVRTNRNKNKISEEEQQTLLTKKIGVIGLSVGQSVAVTIAMERVCNEIVLADFDTLELSNLNRIRTGVHNLGVKKVVAVAREISEIDPFIKVHCFIDGINEHNIDSFLKHNDQLDLVIDECDDFGIKILTRLKAREYGIPLLMEASDRGCIDIERYDLNDKLPIFHGLLDDSKLDISILRELSKAEMIEMIFKVHPPETLSLRLKESMAQIGKTIKTWPQLASSVVLGGAITTNVCRRLMLDEMLVSGRYFVDLYELIPDSKT